MYKRLIGIFALLFLGVSTIAQNNNGKERLQELSKEATTLFSDLFSLQSSNKISSAIPKDSLNKLGQRAISKYLEIYQLDTTSKSIYGILGDCYRLIKDYRKAISWYRQALIKDNRELSAEVNSEFIAVSFICLGELDSSMFYIRTTISLNEESDYTNRPPLIFQTISDQIYKQYDQELISLLKEKGIIPCRYSIEILRAIIKYSKTTKYYEGDSIEKIIQKREKNCS